MRETLMGRGERSLVVLLFPNRPPPLWVRAARWLASRRRFTPKKLRPACRPVAKALSAGRGAGIASQACNKRALPARLGLQSGGWKQGVSWLRVVSGPAAGKPVDYGGLRSPGLHRA